MPEIKNTFLKSKMNKDLDARIIPNGEYRDAQNINISRSEGADVGDLENILSNNQLTSLRNSILDLEVSKFNVLYPGNPVAKGSVTLDNLEVIGFFMDTSKDSIYLFLTDYTDSSSDQLSNFAPANLITFSGSPAVGTLQYQGAACYIVSYNLITNTSLVLVSGNFLNFSKTHTIINVNVIENLLFWTDNRNQPRKINLDKASSASSLNGSWETWFNTNGVTMANTNPYYYNEDHISVSKFAPYECFKFLNSSNNGTLISKSEQFLPPHIIAGSVGNIGVGAVFIFISGEYSTGASNSDIKIGDQLVVLAPFNSTDSTPTTTVTQENEKYTITSIDPPSGNKTKIGFTLATTKIIDSDTKLAIQRLNPDYDINYTGDVNLLKDKFAKFSYRFKYDDDEYSLMAPFTQAAFIPEQFGCFINEDEQNALESGVVSFMENMVDNVKLNVTLPYVGNEMSEKLKVKELQILVKNSDELAVRVIDEINVNDLGSTTNYEYNYLSSKAIKTLPEAELIRVSDQVPVRALTQEVVGNRVVYGNFIDTHSSLEKIDYQLQHSGKPFTNTINNQTGLPQNIITRELPLHTLKQNRSYQVGIVLFDRYGRASSVTLNEFNNVASGSKNSTIYVPYESSSNNSVKDFGKILQFNLNEAIPGSSSVAGYPGLYSTTNPLGYYTYRIVVKQQEQSYYNVYTPGAIAGNLSWNVATEDKATSLTSTKTSRLPTFSSIDSISMLNLFGDNINKVPRELNEVNGNDTTFGSETLLYNRVNPRYDLGAGGDYNTQSQVSKKGEEVISIEPFRNLGEWTTTKGDLYPSGDTNTDPQPWYPYFTSGADDKIYNFHDIFYNAQSNPFIATIETNFRIGATPSFATPGSQGGIENSWRDLGVFETKPTTSALDIYYETSTSGTIEDLNANYLSSGLPLGLKDSAGNNTVLGQDLQYIQTEGLSVGQDATLSFNLVDTTGAIVNTISKVESLEVVDGNGNNRNNDFNISPAIGVSSTSWKIITNNKFVFTSNANVDANFTFIVKFTDTSNSGPGATPLFSNTTLSFSNCMLQNLNPVFTAGPDANIPLINIKNDPNIIFYINPLSATFPSISQTNVIVNNGSSFTFPHLGSVEQLNFAIINNPSASSDYNTDPDGNELDPAGLFEIVINNQPSSSLGHFINGYLLRTNGSSFVSKIRNAFDKNYGPITYKYDLILLAIDANGTGLVTESNSFKGEIFIPRFYDGY